jgi:hypothetical protein
MPTKKIANDIILAAIAGLESQKAQIDAQIAELRRVVAGHPAVAAVAPVAQEGARRKMSAAARARIAEAQRKRWAATRRPQAAPETAKPKRKLSAAGRKAIVAAAKKRWAAKRAEAAK